MSFKNSRKRPLLVGDAYFPFVNGRFHFLRVNATLGNPAFSHDGCKIFPGLSYSKANNTFLKSLRKKESEVQVEFALKIMEKAMVTCY